MASVLLEVRRLAAWEMGRMMTVITHVQLKVGSEPEWDAAMRERLTAAEAESGWLSGQLLMPLDELNRRVIIGTWATRADWERWHESEAFVATRNRLRQLEIADQETIWYEVVTDSTHDA